MNEFFRKFKIVSLLLTILVLYLFGVLVVDSVKYYGVSDEIMTSSKSDGFSYEKQSFFSEYRNDIIMFFLALVLLLVSFKINKK